jgi:hypothetical protein
VESCGKPLIEKRGEAAAQNRRSRVRLDALQVARDLLMRKPNYRFERAERDRAKKARKDEKLAAAARKGR